MFFECSVISRKGASVRAGDISSRINNAIQKLMKAEAGIQIKLYKRTVAYWKSKPEFSFVITQSGNETVLEVGTNDNVYKFIDKGTRVRRAMMSSDFSPKTHKRSLPNARGRGHRVAVNKRFNFPGIDAREFSEMIEEMRELKFSNNFAQYIIPYAMDLLRGRAGNPPNRYWS